MVVRRVHRVPSAHFMGSKRWVVLLIVILMAAPSAMSSTVGDDSTDPHLKFNPNSLDGEPLRWSDPLDDTTNIYDNDGGLVGVEVRDGAVHLLPGSSTGWVASEVITCPPGYRYDFILLDTVQYDSDQVKLSILDASEESSVVGYANETIFPFIDLETRERSLSALDHVLYPEIRIQINLVANGTYRPQLLEWSLYFVKEGRWRDDFITTGKMSFYDGINITDDKMELNLSTSKRSRGSNYLEYPSIALPRYGVGTTAIDFILPNSGRTGYMDTDYVTTTGSIAADFADLNSDGYLDLVCANLKYNDAQVDSQIWWGSSSDTWSSANSTNLYTDQARDVTTGDFNGDGDIDIFFGCGGSGYLDSPVFLNQGGGRFNYNGDIVLTKNHPWKTAAGDLNNDGYDDIVLAESLGTSHCFFGGPNGPDTSADISFTTGSSTWGVVINHLDGDDYMDVMFATRLDDKAQVYIGGPSGPDETADYQLEVPDFPTWDCSAGDIDGDGHVDLAFTGSSRCRIFRGSASGWNTNTYHDIINPQSSCAVEIIDVDKDGYSDLIVGGSSKSYIYKGGDQLPTSADLTFDALLNPHDIAVAIQKHGEKMHLGKIITKTIDLPQDRKWDIVYLHGDIPVGTDVAVSILDHDKQTISGYSDIAGGVVDLSKLTSHRTISLRIVITSENNTTTPVIDYILVEWLSTMAWRDQFYGHQRIDQTMGLNVLDGALAYNGADGIGPPLVFSSLQGDGGHNTKSFVFLDAGGNDYSSNRPGRIGTIGTKALDVGDVNDDDIPDLIFATHWSDTTGYKATSPLYLGLPAGWMTEPFHEFPTLGASSVLLADINDDSHMDVVFAQERDGQSYFINSTLFWGGPSGWNSTADVEFVTTGATDVKAVDLDKDGLTDLVFACGRSTTTATDSMVFLQGPGGFDGGNLSIALPTLSANAVGAADLDGDDNVDLVFANGFSTGRVEIDSYIYWGLDDGGFDPSPALLPTSGATDVDIGDLDGDTDQDIVFSNEIDNGGRYSVNSSVYLNGGSGQFGTTPDVLLPTVGASGVTIVDVDGKGWKDLVFSNSYNGTSHRVPSVVYLGGVSGWSSTPDISLATVGASDAMPVGVLNADLGGYLSETIILENPENIGSFDTLRYSVDIGPGLTGKVRIIDASTWEELATEDISGGTHDWDLRGLINTREHTSVRVMFSVDGLSPGREFRLDDVFLNWSKRVHKPPIVHGTSPGSETVYRTRPVLIELNITDEYSYLKELNVQVECRVNGSSIWSSELFGDVYVSNGSLLVGFNPRKQSPTGPYDIRVSATDTDGLTSDVIEYSQLVTVLNNLPTLPTTRIDPVRPVSTSDLKVVMIEISVDVESNTIQYRYQWYLDGDLQEVLTNDSVPSSHLSRGQNWSVTVTPFDGEDEGQQGHAWTVIQNAPPVPTSSLPDPEMMEDTIDTDWLDLSTAFVDPDGDVLTWSVGSLNEHLFISIDASTGKVTIEPDEDWHGEDNITFIASDGELRASQTVTVTVLPSNDAPRVININGNPIEGNHVMLKVVQDEKLVIDLEIIDIEGDGFTFTVDSEIIQVDVSLNRLVFEPTNDDVGTIDFTLRVFDPDDRDAFSEVHITIEVEDVNDEMDSPMIHTPDGGDEFDEGVEITFTGTCMDPDLRNGQVLNFSWSSNISGHLGYGTSLSAILAEPGIHCITLSVSDGEFTKNVDMNITVIAIDGPEPPDPTNGDVENGDDNGFMILSVILVIVISTMLVFVISRRRAKDVSDSEPLIDTGDATALEMDPEATLPALASVIEQTIKELEQERSVSRTDMDLEQVSQTPDEGWEESISEPLDMTIDRDHIKDVRDVMRSLTQLPRGLPSSLSSRSMEDLATDIVDGTKGRADDGRPVVNINGRWYYCDGLDPETYMREWEAKPARPSLSASERDVRLNKINDLLIDGKISEETYKKLREEID